MSSAIQENRDTGRWHFCVLDWLRGFNIPPNTLIGHIGDGFLGVKWPNRQCQSTEAEGSSSPKDQASILPGPPHHVTTLQYTMIHKIHKYTEPGLTPNVCLQKQDGVPKHVPIKPRRLPTNTGLALNILWNQDGSPSFCQWNHGRVPKHLSTEKGESQNIFQQNRALTWSGTFRSGAMCCKPLGCHSPLFL